MNSRIIVRNLGKKFGNLDVLDSISFDVINGEFLSILGPSGCGKTTLLFLLQGFLNPTKGTIKVKGKTGFVFQDDNLPKWDRGKTGFVFQDDDLIPWKTVKENIEMGPKNLGKSKSEIKKITGKLLKEIGMEGFGDKYPHQISGGMKKRVSVARCLANNPQIIFMDEPFSSLDYLTRIKIHDFVMKLLKKRGITAIMVTHDIQESLKLSDRIVIISGTPAKIKGILKPEKNEGVEQKRPHSDIIKAVRCQIIKNRIQVTDFVPKTGAIKGTLKHEKKEHNVASNDYYEKKILKLIGNDNG